MLFAETARARLIIRERHGSRPNSSEYSHFCNSVGSANVSGAVRIVCNTRGKADTYNNESEHLGDGAPLFQAILASKNSDPVS